MANGVEHLKSGRPQLQSPEPTQQLLPKHSETETCHNGTKCEYMNPDHPGNHCVSIHRPECLVGYRFTTTQEFSLDVCTSSVESNATFRNEDTDDKPHPYKKYREIYKNWMIVPNSSRYDSSFWKYFVAHYTDELAEHFEMKKPPPGSDDDKVLQEWKKLEREVVLETLKASFNL